MKCDTGERLWGSQKPLGHVQFAVCLLFAVGDLSTCLVQPQYLLPTILSNARAMKSHPLGITTLK